MPKRPLWSVRRSRIICLMLRIPIMAERQHFSKSSAFAALTRNASEGIAEVGAPGRSHANRNIVPWPEICYGWTIKSPVGKAADVQTIWIVDKGMDVARLVTAYPHKA